MLKDSELVGAIIIYRQEVRPFTDKQIELVKNFAAQAVIAIENTQLLKELRESLQQQTATADVLKIISSSPGDLRPVFETMLAKAVSICEAKFGTMNLYDAGAFRTVAMHNVPPAFAEMRRSNPISSSKPGDGDWTLAAMTNLDNRHNAMVIVDRIHYTVVALANAIVILAGQFLMPRRAWSIG